MKILKKFMLVLIISLIGIVPVSNAAEKYTDYIPHWTDNSSDPSGALDYTAEIVSVDGRETVFRIEQKNSYVANTFASFRQLIDASLLREGHTYQLEMDLKAEAEIPAWVRIRFGTDYEDKSDPYTPQIETWQHKIMSYTVTDSSKNLIVDLQCPNGKVVFYSDNIKVYDTADELKTNILLNGDFDDVNEELALKNIRTEDINGKTHAVWDTPSPFIKNVKLYNAADMAEIPVNGHTAEITLSGETELVFELEDIYGGVRQQRKVFSQNPDGAFSTPIINCENNKITACVRIKSSVPEAVVILAVYRNGELTGNVYAWRGSSQNAEADTVTLTYEPKISGLYGVKVFVMDSFAGMRPLGTMTYHEIEIF